ncbi:hypothetical protein [Fusobacterium varium]|uniref:hypothetical protein n=1 Tax=Fusobacterium varium TaxID=856 RepID=UPI002FE46839
MGIALRKNITLSEEENQIIQDFCKKIGKSFSEVMRTATLNYIKETEKQDLVQFLANNCEYVDSKEQKEIDELMKKLENDTDEGREISLDELLQL